jgi:CheY-like chemotaxis protein
MNDSDANAGKGRRILLVEDHADTATVLTRMLERSGYEIIAAASVAEARQMAAEHMSGQGVHLVVSDLSLPDGSGLELMRALSEAYGLRGIALSGFGMESDLEQSAAAGFSRHLIKPINIAEVRRTIAELLQDKS